MFFGRKDVLAKLDSLLGKRVASLVTCRGRRRIVEVKRRREISRDVIEEVQRKIDAVKRPEGMSAVGALVYYGQLSPVVAADGYFAAIVPVRKLLGV